MSKDEWISVEDRLPEVNNLGIYGAKEYLIRINAPYESIEGYTRIAVWINGRWNNFPAGATVVTHWQPLPPPPGEN